MSPRFFFDLTDEQTLLHDNEGVEADSLDQAVEQAKVVVNEMRKEGNLIGAGASWTMHVRDEDGVVRQRITIT
ncbi:DUF6894 family protein [Methylobacterium sp. M6A4_1b]